MSVSHILICNVLLILSGISAWAAPAILTGADQPGLYLPMLQGRRVALVVNQTSVISRTDGTQCPLPDSLLAAGVDIRSIMAPEHGYKGLADAGLKVADTVDGTSGIMIYSLYGKNKKPRAEWLKEVDVVVFDLQDVGARFYTYLSTLYYVLQACGEQRVEVVLLDRPNPNDTIDGPVRDAAHASFVGIVPIPLMHGCTLGELAQMMIGEQWIGAAAPSLTIVRCKGWNHGQPYELPVAPSPNLPNGKAIALYPSLCLFEGTEISVGRGTEFPFQVFGHPSLSGDFSFTPQPTISNSRPLQQGKCCRGRDLRNDIIRGFRLCYLMEAASQLGDGWISRPDFFDLLAGTDQLRKQISASMDENEIRSTWQADLDHYRRIRKKYLLYNPIKSGSR